MTESPHWYLTKTLLGFDADEPDRNRRLLKHSDTNTTFTFNFKMKEFDDDETLRTLVVYLNEKESIKPPVDLDVYTIREVMKLNLKGSRLEELNAALDRLAIKALHPLTRIESYKKGYDAARQELVK